ncbi:MAG: ribokinase [Pacificibacter sp.]
MSEVTVVGSINIDLTSYLERWPQVGETVATLHTQFALGGKGANQAVAACKMGAQTTIIGAIGADAFGADAEERLNTHGVKSVLSRQTDHATGMAFIDVDTHGGNIIRLSAGANASLLAASIDQHADQIAESKILLLQNEVPFEASRRAAEIARAAGAMVVMDPAPAPIPFWSADALQAFDVLTPNAHEAKLITGHEPRNLSQASEVARKLEDFGARGAIVTMGKMGVAWFIHGQSGQQVAPKVDAIDTVAAGDCFNGTFAAALAAGQSIERAIDMAVHAAALATTRKGAADSIPTLQELKSATFS